MYGNRISHLKMPSILKTSDFCKNALGIEVRILGWATRALKIINCIKCYNLRTIYTSLNLIFLVATLTIPLTSLLMLMHFHTPNIASLITAVIMVTFQWTQAQYQQKVQVQDIRQLNPLLRLPINTLRYEFLHSIYI